MRTTVSKHIKSPIRIGSLQCTEPLLPNKDHERCCCCFANITSSCSLPHTNIIRPNNIKHTTQARVTAMHNGQNQARREALHVILGSALVFLGVIGSFKLIGLYRTETVCFKAGLTIFTTLICSFCVFVKSSCFIFLV